jgi:hypothetical protein
MDILDMNGTIEVEGHGLDLSVSFEVVDAYALHDYLPR